MSKSSNERVKASQAQIDFLMQYMRQNVCLSRPSREKLLSPLEMHEKWEYLAVSLNSIEGAKKSMQQWQKTWRDIQNSMRKKGLINELDKPTEGYDVMDFDEKTVGLNIFLLDDSQSNETQNVKITEQTVGKPSCRAKLNNRQLEYLLRHMKRNSEMFQPSAGRGLLVRAQLESRWARLTQSLNDLGPPCKPLLKWKQTWRDLRNKIQKKRMKNKNIEEDKVCVEETDESGKKNSRRLGKINEQQLNHIVKHMKQHGGDLLKAVSRPGDGSWRKRIRLESHWTQLAQTLNSLGPPVKPMNRWRQTWRDLRRKIDLKDRIKEISMEEFASNYIEDNTTDSIEEDSKPDVNEEGLFKETTEENRGEDFEFNPIFVDANPVNEDFNEESLHETSKTESIQCLINFEKESLDLRKRQIALEEKRIELKERKLLTEEAKVQALQRIAAALEQNNLNNFNRFNLT